jgi:septum formation protein
VPLILASASPRRADLLTRAGYDFAVEPAEFDEDAYLDQYAPRELAAFLADAKARRVAARHPDDVVLAADTVVAFGDTALGKPATPLEAREMIRLLAGATHLVITGVAVHAPSQKLELGETVMSAVRMRPLDALELEEYIASERWRGKAGGYGIQDPSPIVTCLSGSPSNVVGLPMARTRSLLARAGVTPGSDNDSSGRGGGPSV